MLVVVSRESAKGSKSGRLHDFHSTQEGDLLTLPSIVCEGRQEYRDKCGCGRAFSGVNGGACTVGVVEEMDKVEAERLVRESPHAKEWGKLDPTLVETVVDDWKQLCGAVAADCPTVGLTVRIRSTANRWSLASEVVG